MKANKIILTVKAEVLSIDSVSGLLGRVLGCLKDEHTSGQLVTEDGDSVEWQIERVSVEF